jgi:hypothetical protein
MLLIITIIAFKDLILIKVEIDELLILVCNELNRTKIHQLIFVLIQSFFCDEQNQTSNFSIKTSIDNQFARENKRTSVLLVLLCTSLYFLVLLGTSSYFSVLLGTSSYFSVLLGTSWYFFVLLGASSYFSVLLGTSSYFFVLLVLQKYRSPLVPPCQFVSLR